MMRKEKRVLWGSMLLLATGMAWFGTSCNKDPLPEKEKAGVALAFDVEQKLTRFIDYSQTLASEPRLKSGGDPLETEEAIWLIEAAINYAYANNLEKGDLLTLDTFKMVLSTNGGGLSEADAAYAFLSIFDTLDAKADLLGQTPKKLDMFDIATAEESAGQVEVEVCYSFSSLVPPPNPFDPFTTTDWWWFGYGMGRCDGSGTGHGQDAAGLMTLKLNNTLPVPVNQHFYTDLEKKLFTVDLYLPFPQGVNPNYCACPLFYSTEATPWAAGFHMCLSPDEMNFHNNSMVNLMAQARPFIDPGNPSQGYKHIVFAMVIPTERTNAGGYKEVSHALMVFYGVAHSSNNYQPYYF